MKRCSTTVRIMAACVIFFAAETFAQIPNPGFENWTGGNPDNWLTSNNPPTFANVTQATPARSGSFGLQGSVIELSSFPFPPFLISGPDGQGYPETSRPAALRGWYKFSPVGGDIFYVLIAFKKNGQAMGAGAFTTSTAQSTYLEFVANIGYVTGENPDTAYITVQIANATGLPHVGSVFTLEDLAYGAASLDVKVDGSGLPASFFLHQNYPNPFNPTTTIRYEIPTASYVILKVFNTLGAEVATLVEGHREAGVFAAMLNAEHLSTGTYFYKLTTKNFSSVKKLVLIK